MSCSSASEMCGRSNENNKREVEMDGQHRWDNRRRRHAINITSNPGYQVREHLNLIILSHDFFTYKINSI